MHFLAIPPHSSLSSSFISDVIPLYLGISHVPIPLIPLPTSPPPSSRQQCPWSPPPTSTTLAITPTTLHSNFSSYFNTSGITLTRNRNPDDSYTTTSLPRYILLLCQFLGHYIRKIASRNFVLIYSNI